jgi:hypothetical protein
MALEIGLLTVVVAMLVASSPLNACVLSVVGIGVGFYYYVGIWCLTQSPMEKYYDTIKGPDFNFAVNKERIKELIEPLSRDFSPRRLACNLVVGYVVVFSITLMIALGGIFLDEAPSTMRGGTLRELSGQASVSAIPSLLSSDLTVIENKLDVISRSIATLQVSNKNLAPGAVVGESASALSTIVESRLPIWFWIGSVVGCGALVTLMISALLSNELWRRRVTFGGLVFSLAAGGLTFFKVDKIFGEIKFDGHLKMENKLDIPISIGHGRAFAMWNMQPSPSFDIGSTELGRQTSGCGAALAGNNGWNDWVDGFVREWKGRAKKSSEDRLMLTGTADRLPLEGKLRRQYDSNMGIARARANAVALKLIEATRTLDAADRLSDSRISIQTVGPAQTSAKPDEGDGCKKGGFASDRVVSIIRFSE